VSNLGTRWIPEQGIVVEVSGEIRDQDTGIMQPCVSVSMAGYVAHHLSHVLADWSVISELMESGRGADETALAASEGIPHGWRPLISGNFPVRVPNREGR